MLFRRINAALLNIQTVPLDRRTALKWTIIITSIATRKHRQKQEPAAATDNGRGPVDVCCIQRIA